ncbi:DoxX-like family protein [Paenibacillus alvei]
MKHKPIYVELPIKADLKEVWKKTQTPELHEQWDIRFSSISYLPKDTEEEPQFFLYERKIGFGVKVAGWGKSVGDHNKQDGTRTSSLHFGTNQKISPIKEGKGYWQYLPTDEGMIFLTQYDYEIRQKGLFGRMVDFFFRPLIGWGTALSFDVLKRWLEKGELPRLQYLRFCCSALITALFFLVWVYQGLVPKLLAMHSAELTILSHLTSIEGEKVRLLLRLIGAAEIMFGVVWLVYRKKTVLHALQLIIFPILTMSAVIADPSIMSHPFNPLTFNLSLWILSFVGFQLGKDLPTAANCIRTRRKG